MFLAQILFGVLTTWCTVHAITVPVDRADVQPSPTRSSMIANGWRPLTGYENIGTNVSPSSALERNAPHRPILGNHQTSDKVKPQTNTKNSNPQEYSPPSILGSFSVFGHAATKARPKPKEHAKQPTSATTHYSFLLPPPRDSFRFDIDPLRKTNLRDNEAFLRQPSFHQAEINSAFFSKGSGFTSSTTHSPSFSKSRPFVINGINGFHLQQGLHPPRHSQSQQFEAQKSSNTKSYLQPPGLENLHNFGKENANSETGGFQRFQSQPHSAQIGNGGASNFYSQVDHPPPFKGTFERDPSFLVHESHEISYATPPSNFNYNFRASLPFDNLVPPSHFSTNAPKVEVTKFGTGHSGGIRNDHYKHQFEHNISPEESLMKAQGLSHGIPPGTYYIQGEQRPANSWPQQKSKFTTEINEVLPRKNPPAKFRPESRPNQVFEGPSQGNNPPEVYIIRPSVQQFENPITPQAHQTTSSEPEYETPESISLKHFNEQQFLLQQQLVQQDRQRLQEQELQRQREMQREREEELRKRQEEIRLFEQLEKEVEEKKREEEIERQKQQQEEQEQQRVQEQYELRKQQEMQEEIERRREQQAKEKLEQRKQELLRQQIEEQKKIQEQQFAIEQQEYNRPPVDQERNPPHKGHQQGQESSQTAIPDSEIQKIAEQTQQETQPQVEPEVRPYRPQFPQRGPARRRRPGNPAYVAQATEATVQEVSTHQTLTDSPIQTTVEPEGTTVPTPVTLRPRLRRPGQTLKRRRPSSTTSAPQYESSSVTSSSIREPETSSRHQVLDTDFSKRRRPKPTQPTVSTEETVTERHYIRKRPSGHRQRVNPGEPFEAEVVTEIVRPTRIIYKDTTQWENYPESFKKKDSQEIDTSSLPSQSLAFIQDMEQVSTENGQVFEFSTTPDVPEEVTTYEEQIRSSRPGPSDDEESNIPLEQLFVKPEENHVEPVTVQEEASTPDPTTTTTTTSTTTTTEAPLSTTEAVPTTRSSGRIRPLKYGNATRPRFSIKDYRSRLDYKNRLTQTSTSEAPPVSSPGRRRYTTEKPEENSAGSVTTSRYKYMSRVSYRTTTSSAPVSSSPDEDVEEPVTLRPNRFKPKRKYNMSLYRSRITATTPQSGGVNQEDNKQSTTRPENIYSSAIRRARPSQRNRYQPEVTPTEEATEMTAEETSFYSSMTTPRLEENLDEVEVGKKETSGNKIDEDVEQAETQSTVATPTRRMQEDQEDGDEDAKNESIPTVAASTEASRDAEDALISQRIANLTSSASELYEPGMFKAVSPATESRVINPQFAIATDEPTLPIEAFFQVLAKKDE